MRSFQRAGLAALLTNASQVRTLRKYERIQVRKQASLACQYQVIHQSSHPNKNNTKYKKRNKNKSL